MNSIRNIILLTAATLLTLFSSSSVDAASNQRKISSSRHTISEEKRVANFDCPEEFGYYPHPNDCTQYYVCVFGGALLESCTGGLMYSHELQTCDWPRNVGCEGLDIAAVTLSSSSVSATSAPLRSDSRQRYSHPPPPPPPQPQAVVTSRGQPRKLHHEIINNKQQQQQQLYVDEEESYPPAEEIENDAPQRVLRGQPSTIGQVQRDRDGLRHGNAIPTSSGRGGEKIGVISFGTQQQTLQNYRYEIIIKPLYHFFIASRDTNSWKPIPKPNPPYDYNPYNLRPPPLPNSAVASNQNAASNQRKISSSRHTISEEKRVANFDCPEEFGYYPHPNDCTQYYVCVFGGALLESCTGGLMYSHELQTCDWPRNVGCEGLDIAAVTLSSSSVSATSAPLRSDSRQRYSHPPPPPPPQPQAVVTSRGQPRKLHHEIINNKQQQQQQLYVDEEESYPPAEEIENDAPQRVLRGQPSTIGQVQRDRDGLRHGNAIPTSSGRGGEKIGVISFGTQQQTLQNYRVEDASPSPPPRKIVTTATPARISYNESQSYNSKYDPYYALYDEDVDLYRDIEYTQQYSNNPTQRTNQQPAYKATPAPVVIAQEPAPKRTIEQYVSRNAYSTPQDIYDSRGVQDYDDNSYNSQVSEQVNYRQSTKQQPSRTGNRGRGSSHYTVGVNDQPVVNRGTPPPRSRPTLKPSTSIVSKAAEYVDIYRYPPRRPDPLYPQPQPDKTAAKCRKDVCLLPDCSCGGRDVPGNLTVNDVPQMVLLTFDDAVNDLNKGYYAELFDHGRVNPNGCPIAATFYVSHEWTDYSQVQNLYADGHEMASHSVSHSFGEQFSQKKWTKEVAGQREILAAYGGVHLEDVRGMRAPFLSVGGNKMFKMLYDSNFTYDSSMPIYENKPPSWPYTLDYKLFHDCMIPPCPTRSFPGLWEVPMVMWQDLQGGRCSMADACSNPPDADGVYKMLMKNFDRHYTSNRAPFGLFYHAAWFTQPHHKEGFINFLDAINSMKDVWIITNWQAIQWVRDPTPLSRINSFKPFGCHYPDRPKRCNNPKVCNLWHKSGVRYMRTCQPCPDIYPWTGNTGIRSSKIDNDIED
ncbi:uncharacterized protein LOC108739790 [Agrilus planipennis]|uniref:Uncharacterized protein LOC108739790 n=1 Tax=Agrilus planipennis TaxID=224129 RepID=A0A7F5R6B0_AGRPL|nr:uncharacterized protein LOC108739790 [Agrilus planipennis]